MFSPFEFDPVSYNQVPSGTSINLADSFTYVISETATSPATVMDSSIASLSGPNGSGDYEIDIVVAI